MPAVSKKRILVVDDDRAIARMLERILAADYEVRLAHDGLQALEVARQMQPDLALLDVMLPGMNGFLLAERLQVELGPRKIPFIFLTARDSPLDVLRGIQLGARHYLIKPFKLEEVRHQVAEALR